MAHLHESFDAEAKENNQANVLLPPGKYQVIATQTEMVKNKAGTGTLLKFTFEVIEGQHKGRKLWTQFNWTHPKEDVVRISRAQFSQLVKSCGLTVVNDSDELKDLPVVANVTIKKGSNGYSDSNEIKEFLPIVAGAKKVPAKKPAAKVVAPIVAGDDNTPDPDNDPEVEGGNPWDQD